MTRHRKLWLLVAGPALLVAGALGLHQAGLGSRPGPGSSPFDAARAYEDLAAVVGFGARPSGSDALAKTREYIVGELRNAGLEVQVDPFVGNTPEGPVEMANIRARREGRTGRTIAVGGHYDTKRFDFDFLGANDGGSSTAVVLELARVTGDLDLEHSLEFIFFDGEEALIEWTDADSRYGSRHDIDRRYDEGTLRDLAALVLVDMVGDRDLGVLRETNSTGWLKTIVWGVAADLGYSAFFPERVLTVEDDHIPYLNAGIPAIDLIDLDYPYWHTAEDTLDKTNAESLQVVGDVVYHSLTAIDAELQR